MCFEEQRPIANPNRNSEHWVPEEPIPGIALRVLDCWPTPGAGYSAESELQLCRGQWDDPGMHLTALGPGFFHGKNGNKNICLQGCGGSAGVTCQQHSAEWGHGQLGALGQWHHRHHAVLCCSHPCVPLPISGAKLRGGLKFILVTLSRLLGLV